MDIYKENIIDHYKNPRNKYVIKDPTHIVEEENLLCGDRIKFYLKTNQKNIIEEISFTGEGCAISQATASMLTEILKGKKISFIKRIDFNFIKNLLGVEINPARSKCALLAPAALKKIKDPKDEKD